MTNAATILLVENDPLLAQSVSRTLAEAGYGMLNAASADQALAHMAAYGTTAESAANPAIDLALVALNPGPGLDGLLIAQELRSRWEVPVVFLSADNNADMAAKAEAISPYGCLAKPAGPVTLLSAVHTALRLRAALAAQRQAQAAQERQEAEHALQLREQRRRLSDSLEMAASLLDLGMEDLPDPSLRPVFAHARARLRPFTALYDPLNQLIELADENQARIDMIAYFRFLTADLAEYYDWVTFRVNITTQVDDLDLEVNQARSLGLALTELVTHAIEFGFPPGTSGTIRVDLQRTPYGGLLRVADDGAPARRPLPDLSQMLLEYLARSMSGRFTLESSSTGVTAGMVFRIA